MRASYASRACSSLSSSAASNYCAVECTRKRGTLLRTNEPTRVWSLALQRSSAAWCVLIMHLNLLSLLQQSSDSCLTSTAAPNPQPLQMFLKRRTLVLNRPFYLWQVTFIFHANGLRFWSCIFGSCIADMSVDKQWVTINTSVTAAGLRVLEQQLQTPVVDYGFLDRLVFWTVLGLYLLFLLLAFRVLCLRLASPTHEQHSAARVSILMLVAVLVLLGVVVVLALLHTEDSKMLAPLFITTAALVPLASYARLVVRGRQRKSMWHVRLLTLKVSPTSEWLSDLHISACGRQGVGLVLLITYASLLTVIRIYTSGSEIFSGCCWQCLFVVCTEEASITALRTLLKIHV